MSNELFEILYSLIILIRVKSINPITVILQCVKESLSSIVIVSVRLYFINVRVPDAKGKSYSQDNENTKNDK